MIKIFTTDKDGKITLSIDELKSLLDESYWEGYRAKNTTWNYRTPSWSPYVITTTSSNTSIALNPDLMPRTTITSDSITVKGND